MLSFFINFILVIDILVCLLLILLTLMQRPKNEGLGAAFGGGMTENLFGADTTNVLAKATRIIGALFFVLSLTLSVLYTNKASALSSVQAKLASKPAPSAAATPAASATPAAESPAATATPAASPAASPEAPAATPAK
ncbi:MAG: preprotein translocase subunit SecG [Chthoniobacteraceae bacterium]|nr:preprotein translocase subunit SecG [Chthoniobacteraceae bacterium]